MRFDNPIVVLTVILSSSFLSACATKPPTNHYWDATSPDWNSTLPKSLRDNPEPPTWQSKHGFWKKWPQEQMPPLIEE